MPDGAGGFPQGFTGPAVLRNRTALRDLPVRDCHPLRCRFPAGLRSAARWRVSVLQPRPRRDATGLGSSPFARHYLGNSYIGLFSSGYLDVSVPPVCPALAVPHECGGLPHSDTRGSSAVCAYPRIFAACHVLHRLWMPRHPRARPFLLSLSVRRSLTSVFALFPFPYVKQLVAALFAVRRGGQGMVFPRSHTARALARSLWTSVENIGFEPMTPCLQGRCSSQLS